MKVLINTIPLLSPLTGIGKYTLYTARTLREIDKKNRYTYFYGYYSKKLYISENNLFRKGFQKLKDLLRPTFLFPFLRKLKDSLTEIRSLKFDLYFEPNFVLLERIKAKKRVVSVFDFSFDLFPEWHPIDRVKYFKENFWKNIVKADKIVVPSWFIFNQAVDEYNFDKASLRVVYPGVDHEVFREYPAETTESVLEKHSLPERFILFVGSIEPRKNLKNLLLAYQCLPEYIKREFKLVLVGFSGWGNREIREILRRNERSIIYTGYVSEGELACIYSRASLFVFPSFYEGFGLPPLEAMACGSPVLVSRVASLPEVCGQAALYCEPEKPESIAESMIKVIEDEDLRKTLIDRGKERAKTFQWNKTAEEILNIFGEVSLG